MARVLILFAHPHRAAGFDDPGTVADRGQPAQAYGDLTIVARANGPSQVRGALTLRGTGGPGISHHDGARLCRCGGSVAKPLYDGTHRTNGFRSEENASE